MTAAAKALLSLFGRVTDLEEQIASLRAELRALERVVSRATQRPHPLEGGPV